EAIDAVDAKSAFIYPGITEVNLVGSDGVFCGNVCVIFAGFRKRSFRTSGGYDSCLNPRTTRCNGYPCTIEHVSDLNPTAIQQLNAQLATAALPDCFFR